MEATLDVKMPGDHTDRAALARNELRRHARWAAAGGRPRRARRRQTTAPVRDPRGYTAWLVAPVLPRGSGATPRQASSRWATRAKVLAPGDRRPRDALDRRQRAAAPRRDAALPGGAERRAQASFCRGWWGEGPGVDLGRGTKAPDEPRSRRRFYRSSRTTRGQRKIRTRYAKPGSGLPRPPKISSAPRGRTEQNSTERQRAEQTLQRERLAGLRHSVLAVLAALGFTDERRAPRSRRGGRRPRRPRRLARRGGHRGARLKTPSR